MKSIILLSCFIFCPSLFGQSAPEAEFQKIVRNSFQEIWSDLVENKIPDYYTNDFMMFEGGEIYNLDSVRNYIQNSIAMFSSEENKKHQFKRINRFEFLRSGFEGNIGWIAFHNYAEFKMDGQVISKMDWLESATFIKTENGWKMNFLHSTPFKKENK